MVILSCLIWLNELFKGFIVLKMFKILDNLIYKALIYIYLALNSIIHVSTLLHQKLISLFK